MGDIKMDSTDIQSFTFQGHRDPKEVALRAEHMQAADEANDAQKKLAIETKKGRFRKVAGIKRDLRPPQTTREFLPNPADAPESHKHIFVELGSGAANLSSAVWHTSQNLVGCYTVDWNQARNAHLCMDIRELRALHLFKQFKNIRHIHFTWDCKANCPAGQQHVAVSSICTFFAIVSPCAELTAKGKEKKGLMKKKITLLMLPPRADSIL